MYIKSWFKSFLEKEDDFNGCCICPICDYVIPHKVGVPCRGQMCPNCNVSLIRSDVEPKSANNEKYLDMKKKSENIFPKVNPEICIGCESCVDMCPEGAITMDNGKALINGNICANCRACVTVCPVGAIN
ncbi:MAG: 4Fe-4S binding protein [Bacteroidales bacterium]|nr:4Fe-4S binding protein [Bacteroidales bacterium]